MCATEPLAGMLTEILRSEDVSPQIVGQLSFGRWGESLGGKSSEHFSGRWRTLDTAKRRSDFSHIGWRPNAKKKPGGWCWPGTGDGP